MNQSRTLTNSNNAGGASQANKSLNSQGNIPSSADNEDNDGEDDDGQVPTANPGTTVNTTNNKVTTAELSKHNKESDCWVGYNNKVYDITTFLPNHPGSARTISPYCGTSAEFKKAFEAQHGINKVNMLMRLGVFIGDFDVVGNI